MSQSLANVMIHVIFSTKDRTPLISPDLAGELYPYLGGICRSMGCSSHGVGGTSNHIHIACSLSRTVTVAKLLEELKKNSSKWIKTKGRQHALFAWQAGYGAFSIGQSQLEHLKTYIANQEEHHGKRTFQEEILDFLRRYKVDYDERHIWE